MRTTIRSRASASGSVAISLEPECLRCGRETPAASAARTSSTTPCVEHRVGAGDDPPLQLVRRHVEPDDQRRVSRRGRPEAVVVGHERLPGLGELERAHEATRVVDVHGRGCAWIEGREPLVRRRRVALDLGPDPLAHACARRRRHREVGERRPQVETGAAADDGGAGARDELVDRLVCELA